MKFHLSIDDVIHSLIDLYIQSPKSVFDIPFFNFIKNMNKRYGAVFTLYAFENYYEKFYINYVPKHYWTEFSECGFIRFGFHGVFQREKYELFDMKCKNFYSNIPGILRANTLRLHRYESNYSMLNTLSSFGVSIMLCREEESRNIKYFPPSYSLTEEEEKKIGTVPIKINGMRFIKTSFRIELSDKEQLIKKINELISISNDDATIAVFTHENYYKEYADSIEAVCKNICNYSGIDFTF